MTVIVPSAPRSGVPLAPSMSMRVKITSLRRSLVGVGRRDAAGGAEEEMEKKRHDEIHVVENKVYKRVI